MPLPNPLNLAGSVAGALLDRLEPVARPDRCGWVSGRRASVAVRGVSGPQGDSRRRRLEEALERYPGVSWARVNAPLGRVILRLADPAPTVDELVAVVERVEQETLGVPDGRLCEPPDASGPVMRAATVLVADGLGLAVSSAAWLARLVPLPAEIPALIALVDNQPRLRRVVERAVGCNQADVLLALTTAIATALAQGHAGLAVDTAYRYNALAAARARRAAWAAAEPELLGEADRAGAEPTVVERPRELPDGPVERYADRAAVAAVAALGAAGAATRDPRRALGVAVATLPRVARIGREGFVTQLGRVLARRGVHVMDPAALRQLDRIDTILLDVDALTSGQLVIGDVLALPGADPSEVAVRAYALFRPADATASVTADGWTLGPFDRLTLRGRTGVRERRRLEQAGAAVVLGLAQGNRLMAVVAALPEPAQHSEALVQSARRAGLSVLVAGNGSRLPANLGAQVVPGGSRLLATVRGLQSDRSGVLLVSRHRAALGNADFGVGVAGHDGSPAWGGPRPGRQ